MGWALLRSKSNRINHLALNVIPIRPSYRRPTRAYGQRGGFGWTVNSAAAAVLLRRGSIVRIMALMYQCETFVLFGGHVDRDEVPL